MHFHPQDFTALSNQVEKELGRLLARVCEGVSVRYKLPDAKGRRSWKTVQTCHCNNAALMEIPYNPALRVRIYDGETLVVDHSGEKQPKTQARALVCAVDDCVGLWPRYQHLMAAAKP